MTRSLSIFALVCFIGTTFACATSPDEGTIVEPAPEIDESTSAVTRARRYCEPGSPGPACVLPDGRVGTCNEAGDCWGPMPKGGRNMPNTKISAGR
jgi:hypothetical protein